jgi:hypothetical protein
MVNTINKIAVAGLVAFLGATSSGCTIGYSGDYLTGKVVNIEGNVIPQLEAYVERSEKCGNLSKASVEQIVACEGGTDVKGQLNKGDLILQVNGSDGLLYSLIVLDGHESNKTKCTYPLISDLAKLQFQAVTLRNIKFPKREFNEFNVGTQYWCELEFFRDTQ